MSREKQLIKNTVIITIGKICTQFISFFLLPVYTAMLSTEEYGIVDLLSTYISLLIPIITFQIEQALFRYLIDVRENEKEKTILISTTIWIAIIQAIVFLGIYAIIGKYIDNEYKYFLATNVTACIFSGIMLQIARGLGDNTTYTIGSFISAVSTILLNILFIVGFKWGAYGMLTASLLANILCTIYIFIKKKLYRYLKWKAFQKKRLKKLWKYSVPLIPNALSWWVVNVSDRTIITSFLGIGQNGIYSVANKFSNLYITFYNIFNMTWTESASMYINDKDATKFFSKTIDTSFRFFLAICLGIISCMPIVFPLFVNEKFAEAYGQIPILMLGTLFNVVIGLISVVYIAKKVTKEVAKTSVIAAIMNIVLNIVLVPYIGLYAASVSTAVAYFVMMLFRMFHVQKYVKITFNKKIILTTVCFIVILLYTYYLRNIYIHWIMVFLTGSYAFMINKNSIHVMITQVKSKLRKG